jgi:hypothetical protein
MKRQKSLIQREVKIETTKTAFRLPVGLLDKIDRYSKFLSSSRDHVVNQALVYVISKDSEFNRYLIDKSGDNSVDPKAIRVGGGSQ